tara:strand:- start:64 stop:357 length:294 start_codon:yes stop_codon:yes gene_type:complete
VRVEKKFAYPLLSLPSAIYLIGFLGFYIYEGFDNSMLNDTNHQFLILVSLIIIFRTTIWYSNNGGSKIYFQDLAATWIGLIILGGIITFIQWFFSLF